MANSLKASAAGLEIVDRARQRRGWTKTSTARWWQDAHTSKATLRRFWQGDRIQQEIFIAICQAVGISDWKRVAEVSGPVDLPNSDTPSSLLQLDLEEAPDVESFFGREQELHQLKQWIEIDRCKLIGIGGLGGIGKTALALALIEHLQQKFDSVIWRSLQTAPSLRHLLDSILYTLEPTGVQDAQPGYLQLLHHLRQQRCLLILDGWEAVLQQTGLDEYHQFLQQLGRDRHQSCILLTSRELPAALPIDTKTVRCLTLQGLPKTEALQLLQAGGFTGKELGLAVLVRLYRGNPLALKVIAPCIQSVFGGNVAAFLGQNTLVVGDRLQAILNQQLEHLTELEQDILYWLVIWQEPVSFSRLQTHLFLSSDPAAVLAGLAALERRSLLEKWFGGNEPSFTLQPLVMKVVTDQLVEQAAQEIQQVVQSRKVADFQVLRTHWLLRPGTDDIAGDRILLQLRQTLWQGYGAALPHILHELLLLLKDQSPLAIGYVGCNVMALLQQL